MSAWNPAGQGEASPYHLTEPPSGCVRIEGQFVACIGLLGLVDA